MNHLPFKEWLLSEEPLDQEQTQAFQEHLRECADCRQAQAAWGEVHGLFRRAAQSTPGAGFTARWEARMEARRTRRQRLQLGLALAAGILLPVVIMGLLGTQLTTLIQSPTRFLMLCLAQIASIFVVLDSLQDYLAVFFRTFPVIPVFGAVLAIGLLSFLSVLWLTTIQQLVIARRFVK